MQAQFEVFRTSEPGRVAIKRGFSWPGFFLTWIWAFAKGLWVEGSVLLVIFAGIWILPFFSREWDLSTACSLGLALLTGWVGNRWRMKGVERRGAKFEYAVRAHNPAAAVAQGARLLEGEIPAEWRARPVRGTVWDWLPASWRGLLAVTVLTIRAAVRYRLVVVLGVLLLGGVVLLPLMIKHVGTARGFIQIVLTYTLAMITCLLGFATLWLSCGTMARDVEEAQIQMVAVKPISRWQIWLGKLLGVLALNAVLLAVSSAAVFVSMQIRAKHLAPEERQILQEEIFVARGSLREPIPPFEADAERILKERLQKESVAAADMDFIRKQITEQVKAEYQIVPPGYGRQWVIDLGLRERLVRDRPLQLRARFNAAQPTPSGTYVGLWEIGEQGSPTVYRMAPMSMAADTYYEFSIPPNLYTSEGRLIIRFVNRNDSALLFPLEDGMEVLYREGGFGLNYVRGVAIIFCWLTFLATIGLAAGSFLSFPVAAFFSLAILIVGFSSGTITQVLEQGTILEVNHETGMADEASWVDWIALPTFRVLLRIINLVQGFSPIDSLSTGRSVGWGQLGLAFFQICLVLGGIFTAIGIVSFSRRELATAQGNQ